jgi:hypothetical protein
LNQQKAKIDIDHERSQMRSSSRRDDKIEIDESIYIQIVVLFLYLENALKILNKINVKIFKIL